MSRHFEQAEGLCEEKDSATQSFVFNQTMLRITDPHTNKHENDAEPLKQGQYFIQYQRTQQ